MSNQELVQAVKAIVLRFDPNAQVILYGSRARGDAQPDSDWDFLALLEREKTQEIDRDIHDALLALELEIGEVLSIIIRTKGPWDTPLMRATPFHRFVTAEGIHVCAWKRCQPERMATLRLPGGCLSMTFRRPNGAET